MKYEQSIQDLFPLVKHTMTVGRVPYVQSSPGMGKSAMYTQIAEELNLELIDIRVSSLLAEDISGLGTKGDNGKATFLPFDLFPIEGDSVPKGKNGFLLMLDEFNQGTRDVLSAMYRVINDREVGQYKLHPKTYIGLAGNLMTDGAITNNIGTALASRVVHYFVKNDAQGWIKWAINNSIDPRIIGFVSWKEAMFNNFDPKEVGKVGKDHTFACARTLEFASDLIYGSIGDITTQQKVMVSGACGVRFASEFSAFTNHFSNMPSVNDIIADPMKVALMDTPVTKYAMCSLVSAEMIKTHLNGDDSAFEALSQYVNRMDTEYMFLVVQTVFHNKEASKLKTVSDGTFAQLKFKSITALAA